MLRAKHMDQLHKTHGAFRNRSSWSASANVASSATPVGKLPLFRPEVLSQRAQRLHGEIILLHPIALSIFLWLSLCFTLVVGLFLGLGHYTNKARISGLLLPDTGLIKLYAPLGGTVLRCHVHEGQQVREGDALFELSSKRDSVALGSTETEIRRELLSRRQSLVQERTDALKLSAQQQKYLQDRLDKISEEQMHLALETETTERRLAVAQTIVDKYRQLQAAKVISVLQLEEKEGEPLEQQKALQELQRSQASLEGEQRDIQSQLQRLPLQAEMQSAGLERSIAEIEGQLSENEASRAAAVRAPTDGTVSAIGAKPGITVQPSGALATLVPAGAKLEAHLFAPSRAVGFVKPGKKVLLRYQAYPAEKFGHHLGTVSQVSRVALNPSEYAFRTGATSQEPMYEITVLLPAQVIMLYGQPQGLQTGMAVDADILLDRRRLIEWIFEPLLSLRGRVGE